MDMQLPVDNKTSLYVFYDDWCPLCTKTKKFYENLDWLGKISFMPCRDESLLEKYMIDPEKAIRRMVAIKHKKKSEPNRPSFEYYEGIDTIYKMSTLIPLFWPLVPAFWFFRVIGLGTVVYDLISRKRNIIPIGQCENDACPIGDPMKK